MRGTRPVTNPTEPAPARSWRRRTPLLSLAVAAAMLPLAGLGAAAADDADDHGSDDAVATTSSADDDLLRQGAEVYTAVCSSCHQPGGVGVPGDYPPLIDNPNIEDTAYVDDVIRNGRVGVLTVNGETYDGAMPAQSTLSDADVDAVIFYIQSGFQAPAGPIVEADSGPVAGTELPLLASYAWIAGLLVVLGGVALVLGPRLVAANDRRTITWSDAWLKAVVIAVLLVVGTTWLPAKVLELDTVQDLPRAGQDLIAVGIWSAAIVISIVSLWYAYREKRV